MVDLYSSMLGALGRGTGAIEGELTDEQAEFLERAVTELAKSDHNQVRS